MGLSVFIESVEDTTAFDITVNNIMNGFGTATFTIPNVHLVNSEGTRDTWVGYMDSAALVQIYGDGSVLKFEGYIKRVTGDQSLTIYCEDKLGKLTWYNIPQIESNFKLATGKVATAPINVFIECHNDEGENPGYAADEFNGKYLILSDATKALSNEEVQWNNGIDDIVGRDELDNIPVGNETHGYEEVKWGAGDADRWEGEFKNNVQEKKYMLIKLSLEEYSIPKTATIARIDFELTYYLTVTCSITSAMKSKWGNLCVYLGDDADAAGANIIHFTPFQYPPGIIPATYSRTEVFSLTIGNSGSWEKYFNQNANFYSDGYLGLGYYGWLDKAIDDTPRSWVKIKWAGCKMTVYYDTEEFNTLNEAIVDTDTDIITVTTNLATLGVAEGDTFAVGETMDIAYNKLRTTTTHFPAHLPNLVVNNGIAIEKGIAETYAGISAYALFTTLNKLNSFEFFLKYDDDSLQALKEEDIALDGGSLTGFSDIGEFEIQNDVFGNIDVFWSAQGDEPNPAQASTGIDSPKTFTETRKDILTYAEAQRVADELAVKYASHHRSIPLTFETWKDICVGYLYDITINGTAYSDQICRRVEYKWTNGKWTIVGYFGGGKTPALESVGMKIGDLDRRITARENYESVARINVSRIIGTGTPSTHGSTHENGGADEIAIDASQITSGSIPDARIADDITLTNITQITNRSHTSLSDIGANTHAQIDTAVTNLGTLQTDFDTLEASVGQPDGIATLDALGRQPVTEVPLWLTKPITIIGVYDASGNVWPSKVGLSNGDAYLISVAGTLGGITVDIGDMIIYIEDLDGWKWIPDVDSNFKGYMVDAAVVLAQQTTTRKLDIRGKMPCEIPYIAPIAFDLSQTEYTSWWANVVGAGTLLVQDNIVGFDQVLKIHGTAGDYVVEYMDTDATFTLADYWIDVWVRYSAITHDSCMNLLGIGHSDSDLWQLGFNATGAAHNHKVYLYDPDGNLDYSWDTTIAGTTWIHISLRVKESDHKAYVYVNKTLKFTSDADNFGKILWATPIFGATAAEVDCYITGLGSNAWSADYAHLSSYSIPSIFELNLGIESPITGLLTNGDVFVDSDAHLMTAAAVEDRIITDIAAKISDTAYAASWDTVTTIAPSKNAVYDQLETIRAGLMIGAANAAWVSMAFEVEDVVGKVHFSSLLANVDGQDVWLLYRLLLPTNRGGLKLYISGVRCLLHDADAAAYVSRCDINGQKQGNPANLNTNLQTFNPPNPAWNDSDNAEGEELFAAVDCSSYAGISASLFCVVDAANELDVGPVRLLCYYDT